MVRVNAVPAVRVPGFGIVKEANGPGPTVTETALVVYPPPVALTLAV
jgi:hypothetical protein